MDSCDVLIVGGGPAGSSCARALRQAGLDAVILDRSTFPRDKTCGGWITPAVLDDLEIDRNDYAAGRVLQPITGFRTSCMGGPEVETNYGETISYGIRRFEFDEYLLNRSCARVFQGMRSASFERVADHWIVNNRFKTPLIVGAGGHFCPVAHLLGADARKEVAVVAQEAEFEMTPVQSRACSIQAEIPELYFCSDMKGYGWCFRKKNFLNIGLGRLDAHALPQHVSRFLEFLKCKRNIGVELPASLAGHAYLLYRHNQRRIVGHGMVLVGDAAGLAYSQSGEGIRPAIESGFLAANAITSARGDYSEKGLDAYRRLLTSQFGKSDKDWSVAVGRRLSPRLVSSLAKLLLASRWFSRHVVLDQWFLHRNESALQCSV
jgi:menaquinone-9 beta-reductase